MGNNNKINSSSKKNIGIQFENKDEIKQYVIDDQLNS